MVCSTSIYVCYDSICNLSSYTLQNLFLINIKKIIQYFGQIFLWIKPHLDFNLKNNKWGNKLDCWMLDIDKEVLAGQLATLQIKSILMTLLINQIIFKFREMESSLQLSLYIIIFYTLHYA